AALEGRQLASDPATGVTCIVLTAPGCSNPAGEMTMRQRISRPSDTHHSKSESHDRAVSRTEPSATSRSSGAGLRFAKLDWSKIPTFPPSEALNSQSAEREADDIAHRVTSSWPAPATPTSPNRLAKVDL